MISNLEHAVRRVRRAWVDTWHDEHLTMNLRRWQIRTRFFFYWVPFLVVFTPVIFLKALLIEEPRK